ncbi:uncharacterized protein LOC131688493 [Topomyia yanbarensis]|uniref:uncharacterized protein LOC131688493 n=1 Tax=Topomyia yanbarensis TaxID=2498891 RepID=UPI00273A86C1|nr:uncharacterized protein LOC131688493 [Topomyia yanbarensis]
MPKRVRKIGKKLINDVGKKRKGVAKETNNMYLHEMLNDVLEEHEVVLSQEGHAFIDVASARTSTFIEGMDDPLDLSIVHDTSVDGDNDQSNVKSESQTHDEHVVSHMPVAVDNVEMQTSARAVLDEIDQSAISNVDMMVTDEEKSIEATVRSGNSDDPDGPAVILGSKTSDSEQEINWQEKHNKVQEKLKKKVAENKKLREKIEKLTKELAEMKDIALNQVQENQKLRTSERTTFTTDPEIGITVKQLEEINNDSKNVGQFAQNLALLMYGAETLRQMSVTGRKYAHSADMAAKPPIEERKLRFIYKKAQERVALQKGTTNYSNIHGSEPESDQPSTRRKNRKFKKSCVVRS